MPQLNHFGPMGQGHNTGRKMGQCTNFGEKLNAPDSTFDANPESIIPENITGKGSGIGRGRRGCGLGMGRQNRFRGGN